MDRARRRLASAIDGIRAQFTDADSQEDGTSASIENLPSTAAAKYQNIVREKIEPSHCHLSKIVRHGFPDDPKCMAYDPVQKLCAIGAGRGCVRLLGQAGVDHLLKHESDEPVMHVQFLINEGGLVTALRDDTLHLWNFRQRIPEIVHSLRMSKERVTAVYLPFQSKWLMVGTDKGNVYFVCLGTFELSTYIIYWNKAVDMGCRTHPGSIMTLESCPTESSKVLVVFERGQVVLWNIITKEAEQRFSAATELSPVTAVCWHNDGRQFMCGHQNGSLSIWNIKKPRELVHQSTPHAANNTSVQTNSDEPSTTYSSNNGTGGNNCKPISKLSWYINADGEQLIVFSGGMPTDEGALPSLTILKAKGSLTVLEMDHPIMSMLPLNRSPFASVPMHPSVIAVLLRNDLLVVDMQAPGYPCFEVPHPTDLHESPVTLLRYYSDCPVELIAALTLVGRNQRCQGVRVSEKQWPISGGIGRECATGHQEMLLTGHEDGSIKFWQASSEQLEIMYKLKTGRHFEKNVAHFTAHQHNNNTNANATVDEKQQLAPISHAVADLKLCVDSRLLLAASCSGQVTLFRFAKTECCQKIAVIYLPHLCRSTVPLFSPSNPPSPSSQQQQQNRLTQQSRSSGSSASCGAANTATEQQQQPVVQQRAELKRQGPAIDPQPSRNSSHSTDTTSQGSQLADIIPLKVRGGALRRPAGYQPELVCQIPWINGIRPERVTALALNSAYGLLAMGTSVGLALVDLQTAALIYAWSNADLLGRDQICFWSSISSQDTTATSPTVEHQLSAQTPSPQQQLQQQQQLLAKIPTPSLSRGNTTDTTGQQEHNNNNRPTGSGNPSSASNNNGTTTTLGVRSSQRPNLIKAFTFNPSSSTSSSGQSGAQQSEQINEAQTGTAPEGGAGGASSQQQEKQQQHLGAAAMCNGTLNMDSRASSSESLDKTITGVVAGRQHNKAVDEFVCTMKFINCCAKKGVSKCEPCLWLGTSGGASLAFQLQLPANRITASVIVAPSDSIVRFSGRLLSLAFLDRKFCLLAGPSDAFKSSTATGTEQQQQSKEASAPASAGLGGPECFSQKPNKVLTKASQSPLLSGSDLLTEAEFSQCALFCAENEIRAVALPAYQQIFHRKFLAQTAEEIPLIHASATHIGGQPALVALNGAGALVVLSLPSLRTVMHIALLKHSVDIDDYICNRFQISEHGLGMYMVSPSEVQKFTVSSEIASQVADCMGELFVPCDMPEPPKQQSFLRGVMSTLAAAATGAGTSVSNNGDQMAEIDTVLSEKPASSIASSQVRSVARPMVTQQQQQQQQQQLSGIEVGSSRTVTAGQAAREAMQNLAERSERLSAVTDTTENLRNNAMNIQSRSAKLLEKYEKKKWYQL